MPTRRSGDVIRKLGAFALIALFPMLGACSVDSPTVSAEAQRGYRLRFNELSDTLDQPRWALYEPALEVLDSAGTRRSPSDVPLVWSVSDSSVLEPVGPGRFVARQIGLVRVTARLGVAWATQHVQVRHMGPQSSDIMAISLGWNDGPQFALVGDTISQWIRAIGYDSLPRILYGAFIAWGSDDAQIVESLSPEQWVARAPGVTRITARMFDLEASQEVRVYAGVPPLSQMRYSADSAHLWIGLESQQWLELLDRAGTRVPKRYYAFEYSSSDPTVASVRADGTIVAVGVGQAWVRVRQGVLADSIRVVVTAGPIFP